MEAAILFRVVISWSLCHHIFFPKVSRENAQFSRKYKSKLILSFAEGSGRCKLIECKGDSSVTCSITEKGMLL